MRNPLYWTKKWPRFITVSVLLTTSLLGVSAAGAAEIPVLPLASSWQTVQEDNLTLIKARRSVETALEELDISMWDNSSLLVSGSTTQQLDDELADSTYVATVDADMPLNSALSFGASVSTESKTELSLTYKPFADSDVTPKMVSTYDNAVLNLKFAEQNLRTEIESNDLQLRIARQKLALAETELNIAVDSEESTQGSYELGEASSTDVIDAQKDIIDARQALYNAQVTLAQAELSYQQLLGTSVIEQRELSYTDLQTLVNARQTFVEGQTNADISSQTLRQLNIELEELGAESRLIKTYDSDLTFTTNYNLEEESIRAGVSINLSPKQFGISDKVEAAIDVTLKELEIRTEEQNLAVQLKVSRQRIDIAKASVDSNLASLQQQTMNSAEAVYLFDQGERTRVELAEQQLTTQLTELSTFTALVDLYLSQSNFFLLFE